MDSKFAKSPLFFSFVTLCLLPFRNFAKKCFAIFLQCWGPAEDGGEVGQETQSWPPDFVKYNCKTYDFLLLIAPPNFQTFRHLLMLILFPSQINVLLFYICTNRMEQRICHTYQLFIIWFYWCGVPIITPIYPIYLYLKFEFFQIKFISNLKKKSSCNDLDFYSSLNFIFLLAVAWVLQVWNRLHFQSFKQDISN